MAQNLQLLLRRKKTAQNIAQIARAMEMVSASKIKKAQAAVEGNKPYAQRISELVVDMIKHVDREKFNHPYIRPPDSNKTLLLVISTDKGLCGSLNTNLFKKILERDNRDTKIIALGKKASRFCTRLEGELLAGFNMGTTIPPYSIVYQLIEIINQVYESENISSSRILFNEFNSIFTQIPTVKNVLPVEQTDQEEETLPYLFEPNIDNILKDLLPYYLEVTLYNSIIEAFTSEQAARMIAMQNAKNNALDIAEYLTLSYNKSRQERITNELLILSNNA